MAHTDGSFSKDSIARIEELVHQVEALCDPAARSLAVELVQAVMGLHAAALERLVELAPQALEAMAKDELVASVLVLHGLHPDDFDTRFGRAVEKLHEFFDSRGSGIEVLETGPELVRVRFTGTRPGAGAAAKPIIESVIYEAVPEIGSLIVDGADEEHEPGFVPLASLLATQRA